MFVARGSEILGKYYLYRHWSIPRQRECTCHWSMLHYQAIPLLSEDSHGYKPHAGVASHCGLLHSLGAPLIK